MKTHDAQKVASHAKDLLQVSNRIVVLFALNQPKLSATASQEGTEVIRLNQNSAIHCQGNHLLRGRCGIKLPLKLRIPIHLVEEVIQCIQEWSRIRIHCMAAMS